MSVVQVCVAAEAVVRRARSLFTTSGGGDMPSGAAQLTAAAHGAAQGRQRTAEMTGQGIAGYQDFVHRAVPPLTTAAGSDTSLAGHITNAAAVDAAGAARLDAIAATTHTLAATAPSATTPNQQRVILTALRAQLQQTSQILNTTQQKDTRAAAAVRALTYETGMPGSPPKDVTTSGHDIPLDPPPPDPGYGAHPTWRFTGDDLYTHEPIAGDIKQDAVNDCYLDATMGAIANANPQWIRDRIKFDDTTGQFDVTLFNGTGWQHISVSQDDIQTDINHHGASWRDNGQPHAALWPTVLESAYAKFHSPNQSLAHALDSGLANGYAKDAMRALTGNEGINIDPQQIWHTNEHLDQDIAAALANHQPVTVSTSAHSGGLVPNHVYIIEGISGVGSDAQVTMRNPWESNPNDERNPLVTARLGDLIGSGPTGGFHSLGTHPTSDFNIGALH